MWMGATRREKALVWLAGIALAVFWVGATWIAGILNWIVSH